jgi:hypothetical protein
MRQKNSAIPLAGYIFIGRFEPIMRYPTDIKKDKRLRRLFIIELFIMVGIIASIMFLIISI